MDKSYRVQPLEFRNRLTPKEDIKHVIFNLDPRHGHFSRLESVDQIKAEVITGMPEWSYLDILAPPDLLRWLRRKAYKGDFGCDLCLDVIGSADTNFKVRIYRMPTGAYYGPAQEAFHEVLDGIEKGLLHYLTFTNGDTLQLFWQRAKAWAKLNAEAVRIQATYEGMIHTVQVRRMAEQHMSIKELDAVEEARLRIERMNERMARRAKAPKPPSERLPNYQRKPYHDLEPGDKVVMEPAEFTSLNSLRVVVYNYGRRNGMKFSVRNLKEEGVEITRVE